MLALLAEVVDYVALSGGSETGVRMQQIWQQFSLEEEAERTYMLRLMEKCSDLLIRPAGIPAESIACSTESACLKALGVHSPHQKDLIKQTKFAMSILQIVGQQRAQGIWTIDLTHKLNTKMSIHHIIDRLASCNLIVKRAGHKPGAIHFQRASLLHLTRFVNEFDSKVGDKVILELDDHQRAKLIEMYATSCAVLYVSLKFRQGANLSERTRISSKRTPGSERLGVDSRGKARAKYGEARHSERRAQEASCRRRSLPFEIVQETCRSQAARVLHCF
jgi:hypothetical protein